MNFTGPLLNGRWRLGPRMGAGAQAQTYVARDESSSHGSLVIVKQLRLDQNAEWKKHELFEREVRVLKALDHPGIPAFIDYFESDPGTFNLVMAKAPGVTLKTLAERVQFTEDSIRDLLARLLDILEYIHSLRPPVIHRDIKPANILRGPDRIISLVDFGGVRAALRADGGSTVVGTFGYMAPEQLHGQATPATDIYALGATMVALLGGCEPEEVPRRGLRMDLGAHLSACDRELVEVLEAMTEPDPQDRPQSASEVRKLLASVGAGGRGVPGASEATEALVERDQTAHSLAEETLMELPGPLRVVLRVIFWTVGLAGYAGLAIFQVALLPLIFALIGAFSRDENKPKLTETRDKVHAALEEGKDGFHRLLRPGRPPRQLPEKK